MKLIAIALVVMTIGAGTALAYVQPSTPQQTRSVEAPDQASGTDQGALSGSESSSLGSDSEANRRRPGARPPSDRPPGGATNPVPEPGTMMLASMGLLALGAAVRRRRH